VDGREKDGTVVDGREENDGTVVDGREEDGAEVDG